MTAKDMKQKLTQEQIDAALARLAEVQQEIKAKSKVKEQIVKLLDDEFRKHEAKYRKGVETSKGFLKRIPRSWDIVAKPIVEAGIGLRELSEHSVSLEDYSLRMTGGEHRDESL